MISVFIDSSSDVNAMIPVYTNHLGLQMYYTNIGAQKVDSLSLEMFEMVIDCFQLIEKIGREQVF